jgi:hypothetical protein
MAAPPLGPVLDMAGRFRPFWPFRKRFLAPAVRIFGTPFRALPVRLNRLVLAALPRSGASCILLVTLAWTFLMTDKP